MAAITLDRIAKTFPNGHAATRDLTLEIADGELLVLVGPSGSGKSTALRIIAGLETATSGRVLIDGRDVTDVPPQERDLAMVFQSYALYPHKTVRDNLAFPLRVRGESRTHIDERIASASSALGIGELLDRKPAQLSGGQRQRVALGRALVREPKAFLLDEPLSNLDPKLRVQTRGELALLHRRLSATMVYVTHDQEEAMTLGTRIAVMNDGVLQQVAPPMEVYREPANVFVAGFIGSPAMNLFAAIPVPGGGFRLAHGGRDIDLGAGAAALERGLVGIRPHDIAITDASTADVVGTIDVVEPRGNEMLLHVRVDDPGRREAVSVTVPADHPARVDDRVGLRFRRDRMALFDAATGVRVAAGPSSA